MHSYLFHTQQTIDLTFYVPIINLTSGREVKAHVQVLIQCVGINRLSVEDAMILEYSLKPRNCTISAMNSFLFMIVNVLDWKIAFESPSVFISYFLRSFSQSNGFQAHSNSYSNGYGDNQRNGSGFKSNNGMSNGGVSFKGEFRNDSNGFPRRGGNKFGGSRGFYENNQSFGGQGLKSVEWGVKTLKPVNKPAYVPHPAMVNRSPFEVGNCIK